MGNQEKLNTIRIPEVGDIETVDTVQNGRRILLRYKIIRKNVDPDGKIYIYRKKVLNSEKDVGPATLPLEKIHDNVVYLDEYREKVDKAA